MIEKRSYNFVFQVALPYELRVLTMKLLIILFALLISPALFAQITIKGVIKDANGNAPIRADAHIREYNPMFPKHEKYYTCDDKGYFEFTVDKPGVYTMKLSAVDHVEEQFPLVLDSSPATVEVNARLKADPIDRFPKAATIIFNILGFGLSRGDTMTPTISTAGKVIFEYERKATADTIGYEVGGVGGSHNINGTEADYYVYDGDGDYISVLRTHKGDDVKITLDPSKYPAFRDAPAAIEIKDPFLEYTSKLAVKVDSLWQASYTAPDSHGISSPIPEKHRAILEFLKNEIERQRAQSHEREMQFAVVMLAKVYFSWDSTVVTDPRSLIMNTVPAHSPYWVYAVDRALWILDAGGPLATAYRQQLESNPDKGIRAWLFLRELEDAFQKKNEPEKHRLYNLLKTDYSDLPNMTWCLSRLDPDAVKK